MEVSVVKSKKEIKLYLDGYSRVINETFCYILGNIYNLDKLPPVEALSLWYNTAVGS